MAGYSPNALFSALIDASGTASNLVNMRQSNLYDHNDNMNNPLAVRHLPGGRLLSIGHSTGIVLQVFDPVDSQADAGAVLLYDVFPERAPMAGTGAAGRVFPFLLSGANLDALGVGVKVAFQCGAGAVAEATGVVATTTYITGNIPQQPAGEWSKRMWGEASCGRDVALTPRCLQAAPLSATSS